MTNGRGAEVVFDTVGGPMFEPALKCVGWPSAKSVSELKGFRSLQ
jgi:NADPH:quinone reductase-like Zn-dependent oxidoreductase